MSVESTQLSLKDLQGILSNKEKQFAHAEHEQHKLMRKTAITGLAIIGLIALSLSIFALPFGLAAGAVGLAAAHSVSSTMAIAGAIGGGAIVLTFIGTITALIFGEKSKKQKELKAEIRVLEDRIKFFQNSDAKAI